MPKLGSSSHHSPRGVLFPILGKHGRHCISPPSPPRPPLAVELVMVDDEAISSESWSPVSNLKKIEKYRWNTFLSCALSVAGDGGSMVHRPPPGSGWYMRRMPAFCYTRSSSCRVTAMRQARDKINIIHVLLKFHDPR